MTCSPVELNLLFSQAIVVRTVAISYNVELLPTCKCWICVCVHCGIRDVFTVQVVCKGRGGGGVGSG